MPVRDCSTFPDMLHSVVMVDIPQSFDYQILLGTAGTGIAGVINSILTMTQKFSNLDSIAARQ
jgi:hypothetical protein